MKIAILIPTIKPGGAEKQAALLAATLSEENEVHFVSLWGEEEPIGDSAKVSGGCACTNSLSFWKELRQVEGVLSTVEATKDRNCIQLSDNM